jgi:hypothetical protein
VIWHFSPDRANTAARYNLLLHVGGGNPEAGLGRGIHWHINPKVEVRYWARDEQRLDIPWVEVSEQGKPPRVFKSADCPDPLPAEAEIRLMDCIDCHNRPSHIYRSPHQLIDFYMGNGVLDSSLPYLKRYGSQLMESSWPTTEAALQAIEHTLSEKYSERMQGTQGRAQVQHHINVLQTLYKQNFFPDQGVNWRIYPDHSSHFEFPGCYRCHNDKHADAQDRTISYDCQLCHDFLDQAEGQAAFEAPVYQGGPFRHPRGLTDIWRGHNCTDCHGVE